MNEPENAGTEVPAKKYQSREVKKLIEAELGIKLVTAFEKLDLTKFTMYDLWESCPTALRLAVTGFKSLDTPPKTTNKDFASYCFSEIGYTDSEIAELLSVSVYTLAKWWNSQRKKCMQFMLKAIPHKEPVSPWKPEYVEFIKSNSRLGIDKVATILGLTRSDLAVMFYEQHEILCRALKGIKAAPVDLDIDSIDDNLSQFTKTVANIKTNELGEQIDIHRKQMYIWWKDPLKKRLIVYVTYGSIRED